MLLSLSSSVEVEGSIAEGVESITKVRLFNFSVLVSLFEVRMMALLYVG